MIKNSLIFLVIILSNLIALAQETVLFKQIDSTNLFLDIYYPNHIKEKKECPAMIFFFGGGWMGGNKSHFLNHAKYFSKRGIVCFLADYRTHNKHKTTPFESLKDAKSAIRYLKINASDFGINPDKIIASGGSAGGHLAAATALIKDYNEDSDDLSIDCTPSALLLFNPVIDNGPGGYGYERIEKEYKNFSPLHNINEGAPPTMIMVGTKDELIPVETVKYYKKIMENVGSRCDLKLYDGAGHGFFNYANFEYYRNTLVEADKFLVSLGYLKNEPLIKIE